MNIFGLIKNNIIEILNVLKEEGKIIDLSNIKDITLETPKDPAHGDISTNVAMILSKANKMQPLDLALIIIEKLKNIKYFTNISIAKPGFINFKISNQTYHQILQSILKLQEDYGKSDIGENTKINLEYVSVNPTGPMHIGHARAAVFGDSLANILKYCGYDVTKEYYINDAGKQIDILAKSCFLRYKEAFGENIEILDGLYPGDYLIEVGKKLKEKYGNIFLNQNEEEYLEKIKRFAVDEMMCLIKNDLADLNIYHDVFSSEHQLHLDKKIEKAVSILKERNLVYLGILDIPKGKKSEDWDEREQLLFRSTNYGDDMDRALQKADGSWTYFAAELAYIVDKIDRGFLDLVMILGADHAGYVKRTHAAAKALSNDKAKIDIKLCQLVRFMQNGEPMKMSKRSGNYITVQDVLEVVGRDAIRFMMLTRKNDIPIDFDLEKVKEQSKDNPLFYVQYANARCNSIIRNAGLNLDFFNLELIENINTQEEIELIKLLSLWPKILESSALNHEPHRIVFYLQDLASCFHGLWNKGKENKTLRFILEDDIELTKARLLLVKSITIVISNCLSVLNVEPILKM